MSTQPDRGILPGRGPLWPGEGVRSSPRCSLLFTVGVVHRWYIAEGSGQDADARASSSTAAGSSAGTATKWTWPSSSSTCSIRTTDQNRGLPATMTAGHHPGRIDGVPQERPPPAFVVLGVQVGSQFERRHRSPQGLVVRVGHRPACHAQHTGDQLSEIGVDHVVVRCLARVPQLEAGRVEVTRGGQHRPRDRSETGGGQVGPGHVVDFGEYRDAVEAVHVPVPLRGLCQRKQVTSDDHRRSRQRGLTSACGCSPSFSSCPRAPGRYRYRRRWSHRKAMKPQIGGR
jgi:hypothetical protein